MSDLLLTRHGFLASVFEPWVQMEGSEWGDSMSRLWDAYESQYIWSEEEAGALLAILLVHLDAIEDDLREHYEEEFLAAQLEYPEHEKYWRKRAAEMHEEAVFESTLVLVPSWMKPPPDEDVRAARRVDLDKRIAETEAALAVLHQQITDLEEECRRT